MLVTQREKRLCQILKTFPKDHQYRYNDNARRSLLRALFRSLVSDKDEYLHGLFHGRVPALGEAWNLSKVQGMTEEMEYTEAARGKPCGHIYKSGDAVYRCKTCTTDDTCVLCTRCFEASDHTGHVISQHISLGNSGCCDCGDEEAWRIPVKCAIHTAKKFNAAGKKPQEASLPDELLESIRMTIGRAMDYLIDVVSCSPENLRVSKTEESIRRDEEHSRLSSKWYQEPEDKKPEYALILWNDEKHTVTEVEAQVARACRKKRSFGRQKANDCNDIGRSVVEFSKDIQHLLNVAKIIEQIKITVTIRSSRDTFREQMCGTIIEWLGDIAGCSVGEHTEVLRQTICEELLKNWRLGSKASNKWIGNDGLDDHELEDHEEEERGNIMAVVARGQLVARRMRIMQEEFDNDVMTNVDHHNDDDDDTDSQANEEDMGIEQMDLDIITGTNTDRDLEMGTPGELEDETEVSEATYAGYPPPPPPPPPPPAAPSARDHIQTYSPGSDVAGSSANVFFASSANIDIPPTPSTSKTRSQSRPPWYWLQRPELSKARDDVPLYEDLRERIRLDWLLLYDLRLWKKVRIDLRDLYISTVVSVPRFKRVLGLRFAGLYSVLGQLYLIADREPDHSIINLSVQTFTTPSVTQEVIERGNFLTTLFSMLYTFLTRREVKHPWQVSIEDALAFDHNSVANRRMYHFFGDLKHVFGLDYVQRELREQERYILQFLDLIRLPQGICPNVRAVGDHVEYENDIWISAQLLTKEINRLCRQFAETFHSRGHENESSLVRVLRTVAKATIVNSAGGERARFDQAEIKSDLRFKELIPFSFDRDANGEKRNRLVVDFVVEKEAISFHHALHYTLSWLIDGGKSMPLDKLKSLLHFTSDELAQPPPYKAFVPGYEGEDYLMALFDFPLRVCAWLAQMKAGMWVRNGLSLRHQMSTYRGVSHRDLAHHRDIFLLQTAMVVCDPSRVLASIIERFGMDDWMRGNYWTRTGFEPGQQLDVSEDFIHLLIVLLSDRTSLQPSDSAVNAQALAIRRDIAHILCFKPLSFSELNNRFADKATDLEDFQDVLEEMTIYRPPEGLSDTGSFELKKEYLADIDPYTAHYTKNQRDEAESAYRMWMASRFGKSASEIVFEPKLPPIESGIFVRLSDFTRTPLFVQIIFYSLNISLNKVWLPETPATRMEAYLHVTLHLLLAAVLEDDEVDDSDATMLDKPPSLIDHVLRTRSELGHTIFETLIKILENLEMKGCHPKIRLILHRIRQKQPLGYSAAVSGLYGESKHPPSLPVDRLGFESPITPLDDDQEVKQQQAQKLKKEQALDRHARVMAQFQQQQKNFLDNQDIADWDDADELESNATGGAEDHRKTWKYPTGNCILCQEETNDSRLFGTFALMTNSTIFRETEVRDPDLLGEVLLTPNSLDRSADGMRPFGIAGQNRTKMTKRRSDGREFESEHHGLARGFPSEHTARGPVSTGCGHIMHYSCFDTYCIATQRRHDHQIARQHPERVDLKEFVCPLCKALGNSFLPIIWRGKEEAYPGVLQNETPFEQWLSSGLGLTVSRVFKSQEGKFNIGRLQETFVSYTSKSVIPPVTSRLSTLMNTPAASPISPLPSTRASSVGMPGLFPTDDNFPSMPVISPSHPLSPESLLVNELVMVYVRLRDTVQANRLPSQFSTRLNMLGARHDLVYTDSLSSMLGHSIAAAEIAQRGIESEYGQTLIEKMPSAVTTHLRILSETALSYVAIGGIRNSGANALSTEFVRLTMQHLLQLFVGHPDIEGIHPRSSIDSSIPAALDSDSFVLLAESTIDLVPTFNFEVHHIVQVCYILEIVKVTLYLTSAPDSFEKWNATRGSFSHHSRALSITVVNDVKRFLERISTFSFPNWPVGAYGERQYGWSTPAQPRSDKFYMLLYSAIYKYALAFVRKAVVLLNVRYGVDFSEISDVDTEESELDRLTQIVRLPSPADIMISVGRPGNDEATILNAVIAGWVAHWQHRHGRMPEGQQETPLYTAHEMLLSVAHKTLRPSHPAIFELIGLPKMFDTLTYEVTRRRCPSRGSKMEDAALCLFCGAFFCGQALCCSKDGKGGCYQHMQE